MNWKRVKLGDYLFFQEGPGVRNTQFRESGVKLLNVGNINGGKINLNATKIYISDEEAYGKYKHFLIDEGDLVIASSGIVVDNFHNKIAFIEKEHLPLCLNTSTIRFKVLDASEANLKFFSYYLQSSDFKGQLRKLVTGSAQLNFGPSHLKQIQFQLPDLATQKHIAEVLDKADALRQQNRQLLANYDELLQSTFIELFGDPVKNPKGWEVKKLGEVAKAERGRFSPRPRNDPSYFDGNYPFIQTGDISSSNHRLTKWQQTLNEKGTKVSKKFDKGTIVVAIVGATIGASAILEIATYAPDSVIGITVNNKFLNNYFLEYVLRYWKPIFLAQAPATARANINLETFKPLPIPIPPLPLQQHFAKIVEQIEAQKAQTQAALAESEALFEGLLAGYFN